MFPINRDVIFVAVADEEAGTDLGSKWLVNERPDLLGGDPEYVINEVGGFTVHRDGKQFYPVQVAEKGIAWLRMTAKGTPGHSSLPPTDSPVATLANAISKISKARLPWHPSPEASEFIESFAAHRSNGAQKMARRLSSRFWGPKLINSAIPDTNRRATVEAILRNTAVPTRFTETGSTNVLTGTASVDIDGRLAAGQTAKSLIAELGKVLGKALMNKLEFEILRESPAVAFSSDTPLYRAIEHTLLDRDPDGIVVPSVIPGFTDSHNYAKLGATCYGFYPLQLPEDLDFAALFHGDDERIPVNGFYWGLTTFMQLLTSFLTGGKP